MSITPVPRVAIIVVAAGSGTRLGAGPKAFVGLDEHTILRHALLGVFDAGAAQVVIVAPAGREGDAFTEALETAGDRRDLVSVVTGGASRQSSVAAGIDALWPDIDFVLVHDAARCLTPSDVFDRVMAALELGHAGAVPVLPVVDTIKRVQDDLIVGVVDRSELSAAQTPQGFRRDILETAYRSATTEFTDDAALVGEAGHTVLAVQGDARAFKITTPADLDRARRLVSAQPLATAESSLQRVPASPRVGIGTDVHAVGGDGPLWLAGLEWPSEPALSGHSDGDAVAHAIVDALLAAAGLGDIGTHFGTDRPEFAGAHADAFLARTRALLGEAGFRIGNVSVQVQARRPRLAARRVEAEAVLSRALGGAPVSVSATTTDGLGFTGRGDGVAAFAVALVLPA
ncbi:2-C-methyl-D-erythritol 4-phosphate cytidylyltransferase/2-C-methyl-D-erythritol 2,4-cyclodiphosphate synthase [Microbacterium sp. AK009]|uniref:2-C-methyl-D-erythritol 4-phosphate cytidylyltransferase n=1 Tax=Microbacterium sp. AK009 TaxID=2723068 RepID=UPI0015CD5BDC|nr:2-C-methyl-D-erythritol 4-phosphate cytidylyltransferase [Microbacterium sp. AK009]NYF17553.1 2-C-methyl-D-erythritol 4-phosphate cytidylyltransferase/2-C-methyl-D-erythritol 2,4-cyclodiphosphate synthase [Microbacterium sp. AK009]